MLQSSSSSAVDKNKNCFKFDATSGELSYQPDVTIRDNCDDNDDDDDDTNCSYEQYLKGITRKYDLDVDSARCDLDSTWNSVKSDEYNNPPSAVQEADKFLVSDFCNDYLGGAVFREDNYDRAMKEKPINKFHAEGWIHKKKGGWKADFGPLTDGYEMTSKSTHRGIKGVKILSTGTSDSVLLNSDLRNYSTLDDDMDVDDNKNMSMSRNQSDTISTTSMTSI